MIEGDFRPPREAARDVPRALNAIVLKAMARDPGDRYPSPTVLAEDVEHWLADEPVAAWREPLARRLGRWARRHKPVLAGAAALLITAVVTLSIGLVLVRRAELRRGELPSRLGDGGAADNPDQ